MTDPNAKRENDIPDFYIFKGEDGKHYKTDQALTNLINRHVFLGRDFEQNGREFYPQWQEPEFKSITRYAWYLTADGERRVRWYWAIVDHKKSHGRCERLEQGQCAVKIPLRLGWSTKAKLWTIVEPTDRATSEQVRKIKN